jgi:glycosyltransferase involved in cell wall biosynthesis
MVDFKAMQQHAQIPISVIVPAYNEEAAITAQIEVIRKVLQSHQITHEILVVDDGSEDSTAEKALQAGARVLRHPENRGYGAALKSGIVASKYTTIAIIDADGTYPPDQIPELVAKLGTADMVVGARIGEDVHIPWVRRPAKWLLGLLANRIAGRSIPDLNSGLRVFRRECVKQYFPILSNRFSFTTTVTLSFLADDYRVVYHPINYHRRVGKSKIHPRHFLEFIFLVLRMAMLFNPLRVFVPLASLCGLLGMLKVVFDITLVFPRVKTFGWSNLLSQPVLSTSSLLLLLAALHLLLIGMVAEGLLRRISQQRRLVPSHSISVSSRASGRESVLQEISSKEQNLGGPQWMA